MKKELLFAAGAATGPFTEKNYASNSFSRVRFPHSTYEIEQVISTNGDYPLLFAHHKNTKQRVLLGVSPINESKSSRVVTNVEDEFEPLALPALKPSSTFTTLLPTAASIKAVLGTAYNYILLLEDGSLWIEQQGSFQLEATGVTMYAHGYNHVVYYSTTTKLVHMLNIQNTLLGKKYALDPLAPGETIMNIYSGAYLVIIETRTPSGDQNLYAAGTITDVMKLLKLASNTWKAYEMQLIDPVHYGNQKVTSVHIDCEVIIFMTEKEIVLIIGENKVPITGVPTSEVPRVFTCFNTVLLWYQNLGEVWARGVNDKGQLGLGHRNVVEKFTRILRPYSLSYLPLCGIITHYESIMFWFKDTGRELFLNPDGEAMVPLNKAVSFADISISW